MNLINWSIPPRYIVIVLSLATLAFIILCTVMVIGMLKKRHLKAAVWFKDIGFSLEASDRHDPPEKDETEIAKHPGLLPAQPPAVG